jgi:hypothetical protein
MMIGRLNNIEVYHKQTKMLYSSKQKLEMVVLDYYNECSTNTDYVYFERIQFLGVENINDNLFLRFELENGNQMRRSINDVGLGYTHMAASNGHK